MGVTTEAASNELALLKPRQSLQNMGDKKEDEKTEGTGFQAFGADGFTFSDFLDIVNPLQHIPIVSSLYRQLSGDDIDPGSRIAGGTLFGGPIGTAAALANVALDQSTGKDMGDHVLAFLSGDEPVSTDTVIAAQTSDGGEQPSSPIAGNLEVLEWARREAAFSAATQTPALAQVSQAQSIEPVRPHVAETRKPSSLASDRGDPHDITTNADVLAWAQGEVQVARSPGMLHERKDQDINRDQKRVTAQDAAQQKTVASGMTHEQLMGAAAPSGGWFSETMLLALTSYQDSAGLGKTVRAPAGVAAADQNMGE